MFSDAGPFVCLLIDHDCVLLPARHVQARRKQARQNRKTTKTKD